MTNTRVVSQYALISIAGTAVAATGLYFILTYGFYGGAHYVATVFFGTGIAIGGLYSTAYEDKFPLLLFIGLFGFAAILFTAFMPNAF